MIAAFIKAWKWVKKHTWALVLFVLGVLGLMYLREHKKRLTAEELNKVEQLKAEIAGLQAKRDALVGSAHELDPQIAEIDRQLIENKREVVTIHEENANLSDKEVGDAFARLGF